MNSISFISSSSVIQVEQSHSIIKGRNYYIAKSIDHHPELIRNIFQTEQLKKCNNIFQDPVNLKIIQHDPVIGPRYEKNKIITRSIVGKPDIFRKKNRESELHMPTQQTQAVIKHESPLQRRLSTLKMVQSPVKISKKTIDKTLSNKELMDKISSLENRLIQCRINENTQYTKLTFEQRQARFREQRALEDFERTEKMQADLMQSLSARVNRDPSMSLMMDLYKFRRKQEYSTTNDRMRQVSEYRGQQIIEVAEQNQPPFFLSSDRQEIIRKPYNIVPETSKSIIKHLNEDRCFKSFTTNELLAAKEQAYKNLCKEHIQANFDDLMIMGRSKYESELQVDRDQRFLYKDVERGTQEEEDL